MISSRATRTQPLAHWFGRLQKRDFIALIVYPLIFQGYFEFFTLRTVGSSFAGIYRRPLTLGFYAMVAALLLYQLTHREYKRGDRRLRSGLFIVLTLLGLMAIYAYLNGSASRNLAFSTVSTSIIEMAVIIAVSFVLTDGMATLQKYIRILAWSFGIIAILQIFPYLGSMLGRPLPFGIGDFTLIMPFVFCYFVSRYFFDEKMNYLAILMAGISVIAVMTRFQKFVIVPFVLTLVAFVAYCLWLSWARQMAAPGVLLRRLAVILGIVTLFVAILLIAVPNAYEIYRRTILVGFLKISPATFEAIGRIDGGRFVIWAEVLRLLGARPLFGYGYGAVVLSDLGDYVFPHNFVLALLLYFGIAGLALIVGLLAIVLRSLRPFPLRREFIIERATIFGYGAFVIAFGLIGVLWNKTILLYLLAVSLGMLMKVGYLSRRSPHATLTLPDP